MSKPYTVHEMPPQWRGSRFWEVHGPGGPNMPFCSFCSYYGARKIADALNAQAEHARLVKAERDVIATLADDGNWVREQVAATRTARRNVGR